MAAWLLISSTNAQVINFWRGPNRDGKYPDKNLLKAWPEAGPTLVWSYNTLGKGYTSPSIVDGKLYITGLEGDKGFLYIFSEAGALLKKVEYGKDVIARYPGPRSSPLIDGKLCYIVSGFGQLVCMNTETDQIVWSKELFKDFDGANITFSFTENMLIDGDKLYVFPGGKKYNVVALNKKSGELIWSGEGKGDVSAYCSPILITHNGKRMLINMMSTSVVAINPADGTLMWSYPFSNSNKIHPNSPIYRDGFLYIFCGYSKGGEQLQINPEGTMVTSVWKNQTVDPQMGGAILKGNMIYASGDRNRKWFCVDWTTGAIKHQTTALEKGTLIEADDMLYLFTEKKQLALVQPQADSIKIVSQMMIVPGSDEAWAHLVIKNGILYVRRGNALLAFDVRKK